MKTKNLKTQLLNLSAKVLLQTKLLLQTKVLLKAKIH